MHELAPLAGGVVVVRCDVVGDEKPKVWKDEPGWWVCDQAVRCRVCHAVWFKQLADDVPFEVAIEASAKALPTDDDGSTDPTAEVPEPC